MAMPSSNAYYNAELAAFLRASTQEIIGALASNSQFSVEPAQRDAWLLQVSILQSAFVGLDGTVFLEFVVPRIGSRLDVVLISGPAIFAIEFKVGESDYRRVDINQVWDYALDLKNFHKSSHDAPIIPMLVATEAPSSDMALPIPHADGVYPPTRCNPEGLAHLIQEGLARATGRSLDASAWDESPYQPTPSIIEAAQALYSQHSVEAIARHDAGARNLSVTSQRVEELIDDARQQGHKIVVFVTGVPGAGKTLVGLNVATKKRDEAQPTHAVFLSGNGGEATPLTKLDPPRQTGHLFPILLPGGRDFLMYVRGTSDSQGIYVGAFDSTEVTRLISADRPPIGYLASGWLLFMQQGILAARRYDVDRRTIAAEAIAVADSVASGGTTSTTVNPAAFSAAPGLVAYRSGSVSRAQLTWFDRAGQRVGTLGPADDFLFNPELSRDDRRVAVRRNIDNNQDIWLLDQARAIRFTFAPTSEQYPAWSPDGRFLLYNEEDPATARDLWVLPLEGEEARELTRGRRWPDTKGRGPLGDSAPA